jgi:hypothetical protein
MFKFVDNDACTLWLQFVDDQPTVFGDVRYFNRHTYKETKEAWDTLLIGLVEEGYTHLFSRLKKDQETMINFEKRVGFTTVYQDTENVLLVKEL